MENIRIDRDASGPNETLGARMARRGVSRRSFLKFASYMVSVMALPPSMAPAMAEGLQKARRQSVIWLSFQECTGCSESITRAHGTTIEDLIFDFISLDSFDVLQVASGVAAEEARKTAMRDNYGDYILVVEGSVSTRDGGIYSTVGGRTNMDSLAEAVEGAKAVVAVGTCATFGGLPMANPNPTGAVGVDTLVTDKPVINIPGCPPVPEAMIGTLVYILSFGELPALDSRNRPLAFFGETIHDRCYRRPFYEAGKFAKSFDDEGARKGWCLYELGCKGPVAHNTCATLKWNGGISFPIQSGHGCFGCASPGFWDQGGFYKPLSASTTEPGLPEAAALAVGAAVGAGAALSARERIAKVEAETLTTEALKARANAEDSK